LIWDEIALLALLGLHFSEESQGLAVPGVKGEDKFQALHDLSPQRVAGTAFITPVAKARKIEMGILLKGIE
jgi:hypothetical protein